MYISQVGQSCFAHASLFLFLCCWSALPRGSCFDHGVWPVICLDQCGTCASKAWNRVPCFSFLCILRYPLLCAVLSSAHKSRSVVKLHWCPQNRFKSCPFVSPSGKVLRCLHQSLSSSFVLCSYPGTSHRHRLVNSVENKFVSAHSEQCESVSLVHFEGCRILCLVHPRTLRSTRLV